MKEVFVDTARSFVDTDHVVSLLHDLDKDQLLYIHNVVQSLLEIEGEVCF